MHHCLDMLHETLDFVWFTDEAYPVNVLFIMLQPHFNHRRKKKYSSYQDEAILSIFTHFNLLLPSIIL